VTEKLVIFNADDFGYGCGINRGIIEAHANGVVTSTSLMVNTPATREALELASAWPDLSIGLHANFTNEAERLVDFYDSRVARDELRRQFDLFVSLMGRLPTHLDSHQHVHRLRECRPAFEELAAEHGLHLRDAPPVTYKGGFYGQWEYGVSDPTKVSLEALDRILRQEISAGIYEMCVHPGRVDAAFQSVYHADREQELATLTDPRVRTVLAEEGIRLIGYRDLPGLLSGAHEPTATPTRSSAAQRLLLLPERYAICSLREGHAWTPPSGDCAFLSVTQTKQGFSVVCQERYAPRAAHTDQGWRCLEVQGPLDLSLVGVLAGLSTPLAQEGISLFAVSTFDTDYLLVREASLQAAVAALRTGGHHVIA
jgi:chitin disaccharide deacetylase